MHLDDIAPDTIRFRLDANGQHTSGMSTAKLSRVVSRPVVRIPELHYRPAGYVRGRQRPLSL